MDEKFADALFNATRQGQRAAAAAPDQQVWERLSLVNRMLPVPSRLSDAQNAALARFLMEIALLAGVDDTATAAMVQGMHYGFQLGHDYVLKHGRLG